MILHLNHHHTYICSKVNIWNVGCMTTAFIFNSQMDVLVTVMEVFETENVSNWGGLESLTFGFILNTLTIWAIRATHLLSLVVEYWLQWYRYFCSKVSIWNVNYACATAFIFHSWIDVLVKVLKFFTWGELEPPTFRFMRNDLSTWAVSAICLYTCSLHNRISYHIKSLDFVKWGIKMGACILLQSILKLAKGNQIIEFDLM